MSMIAVACDLCARRSKTGAAYLGHLPSSTIALMSSLHAMSAVAGSGCRCVFTRIIESPLRASSAWMIASIVFSSRMPDWSRVRALWAMTSVKGVGGVVKRTNVPVCMLTVTSPPAR